MTLLYACEPFATTSDVLGAPGGCPFEVGDDVQGFIDAASDALFRLSGGRVHGLCALTVYPTIDDAGCFDGQLGRRPSTYFDGWLGATVLHEPGLADQFGGRLPVVLPDDTTVVTQVKIDGVVLDPSEYILVNGVYLIRRTGAWPRANDITQASGTGTWSITYTLGSSPDPITRAATIQVAIEIAKSFGIGSSKGLGPGVISANIQGVQVTVDDLVDAVRAGRMAVPALDRFLALYAPAGPEAAGVYTPEMHPYRLLQVTHYS